MARGTKEAGLSTKKNLTFLDFLSLCHVSCGSVTSNSSLVLKCMDGNGAKVKKLNRPKRMKTIFGVVREGGLASVLDLTNYFILILNVP